MRLYLFVVICGLFPAFETVWAQDHFVPPASPRITYNFNIGWKFFKEAGATAAGAQAPEFDDTQWQSVSTPHSYNETDSFRTIISHGGGDRGTFKGTAWYRRHFKLPASAEGKKVFLEFEGMRQAGDIYLNGRQVGLYENGVTAYGIDLTSAVNFGGQDNVLAVHVDNRTNYLEKGSGVGFEWNANDFNPDHGGINRRVWLHVTGKIHQTLPLYYGLQTTGVYVYPSNFSIANHTADVTVESEVRNDSGDQATVGLSAAVVDADGVVRARFAADPIDMVAGEKTVMEATGPLAAARFWSDEDPWLYKVYTLLTVDGKVVDVNQVTTGFRKAEYKGGAGVGGVYLNDKQIYLKGFAQRSSDEWAGLGQGYPDWMHDVTARLIRDDHANYVRWMHIAPQKVDVESFDRNGIIEVAPAGDKERDVTGRQWEQRVEVMRDTIIYFRNSPSILFWEAGNTVVTPEHMTQMVALRQQWDPHGMRVMGTRGNSTNPANAAITPIAEFYGVMIGQDRQTESVTGPNAMFRGYSIERRDRAPIIETEDFRDEAGRRFWDDFSPPHFGFKAGPQDTYHWNSETFALASIARYSAYWNHRIQLTDPARARWSGYASIYFSDSNADGRQDSSEVCRVSGKVDAVRLPKEIYFAHQVMQNPRPQVHIIGHWSYPTDTRKNIYVVSNTKEVELFLNDQSLGKSSTPVEARFDNAGKITALAPAAGGFLFAFPDISFKPGILCAVGTTNGQAAVIHELKTAGPPAALKLTEHISPAGLQADGQDVAYFDVEVVDAAGQRCPTDEARVDFQTTGPCLWRGGYNSGLIDSTNNMYLNTECGINRVAIRSLLKPGVITVRATREGLAPASVTISSVEVPVEWK